MWITDMLRGHGRLFAPADGADGAGGQAAAAGAAAAEAGATGAASAATEAAATGAAQSGTTDAGATGAAAGTADGKPGSWVDGRSDIATDLREWLVARGMAAADKDEALVKLAKGHFNAEKMIGKGLDRIIERPKAGQPVADWMRENAEVFGLPKTIDEMTIEKPADLPADVAWDEGFEAAARKAAFEHGLSKDQLAAMTGVIAEQSRAAAAKQAEIQQTADLKLRETLAGEWGKQAPAMEAMARQAASVIAEQSGLGPEAIDALGQLVSLKAGGDAIAVKIFATIGKMMAEDGLVTGGAAQIGTTPADARQKAAQMRQPDGEYFKAVKAATDGEPGAGQRVRELTEEIKRLDRLASGA
jgi:hypothetical protein